MMMGPVVFLLRSIAFGLLLVTAALAPAACTAGSAAAPEDPAAELRAAGQALGELKSVAADVRFGAGTTYQGYTLDSASSRLALPGNSDTTLKVKQNDFLVDIRIVVVGGHAFIKLPFGKFSEITPAQAGELPNVGGLFDRQHGLPAVVGAGTATSRSGIEKVGGVDCDRLKTTYTAVQVAQALNGLKPSADIAATLWVSPADHRVRRVLLNGPLLAAGQPTTIQVDLHDFDGPVTIVQPTP